MEFHKKVKKKHVLFMSIFLVLIFLFLFSIGFFGNANIFYENQNSEIEKNTELSQKLAILPLDIGLYDLKLKELANNPIPKIVEPKIDPKTGEPLPPPSQKPDLWPVKTIYPNAGAILPFKRIVAYYGNLYSTKMGVLGEYPPDEMLAKLQEEVTRWETADPTTSVMPALHYIAVTAQGTPGEDGKYRFRMPDKEIDKVIEMAEKINAIVFLDIQVGFSNLQTEVPLLEKYLKMPQVHLGIDPEFSMKTGIRPGKIVGTFDASDINFTIEYMAKIVRENNLTPKILVVHRYTQKMVTNYQNIRPLPEVQIVMDMDGWGGKAKKINTYKQFIYSEPVQFTGFKLFYKNDILDKGTTLFTPEELIKLNPRPIYIQYQ
jgi:hypothetical protein